MAQNKEFPMRIKQWIQQKDGYPYNYFNVFTIPLNTRNL